MLFQSDYWFAENYSQRVETIQDFIQTDDGIRTLIILDKGKTGDARKILDYLRDEEQMPCHVKLVIGLHEEASQIHMIVPSIDIESKKTIYIINDFDSASIALFRNLQPILAIFV